MTSFKGIEIAAIGNDQAWKAMVTNYYVKDDFRKVGGIDHNHSCCLSNGPKQIILWQNPWVDPTSNKLALVTMEKVVRFALG